MKKKSFIVFVYLLVGIKVSTACLPQSLSAPIRIQQQTDTASVLRDLLTHKEKYQHQPLSVLLKDLPYKIKSFSLGMPHNPGGPIKFIYLHFDESDIASLKLERNIHSSSILLYFENDIPATTAWHYEMINQFGWAALQEGYFGGLVIKNVKIVE